MTIVANEAGFPGPEEIEGFWAFDKMHAPRPITPLASDLVVMTLAEGFTQAQAEFDAAIQVTNKMVNYYYYVSFHPLHDQAEAADRKIRYQATLAEKVPGIGHEWTNEWEPEIIVKNDAERTLDYTTLTDEQIPAKLVELEGRMLDFWRIHGRINFVLIASSQYCDFYDEVMDPEDPTEAYHSIQGFETRSVAASRGLWRLSRIVRDSPALKTLFETAEPAERLDQLGSNDEGRAFLDELHAYLGEFGWRSDAVYDIADVTWREDPTIPLGVLNSYVSLDDSASPEVVHERSVRTREQLLAKARAKLMSDPDKLARFDVLYDAAQYSNPLTENHAFWIDQMYIAILRRFVLEIARRLVQKGLIVDASDVFYFYRDELLDTFSNGTNRKELLAQRRAEMAAWSLVTPPPVLGTPPPPEADPFMDAVTVRLLGITPPDPTATQHPDVLQGVPGSPGVVRGPVRVVRSLAQASVLEEGDIMVCEMTLPPWVPLFSVVSGVVADIGGVLSHCAIVAREFELPAVVGTMVGTTMLQDGMIVEVDGIKGTVTVLERP
ncbi:MAG: PEP-utilizing enzyme [Acidimicrobiales bacterium]